MCTSWHECGGCLHSFCCVGCLAHITITAKSRPEHCCPSAQRGACWPTAARTCRRRANTNAQQMQVKQATVDVCTQWVHCVLCFCWRALLLRRCSPPPACRTPHKWTGGQCCQPLCPTCMTISSLWQQSWRKHTARYVHMHVCRDEHRLAVLPRVAAQCSHGRVCAQQAGTY